MIRVWIVAAFIAAPFSQWADEEKKSESPAPQLTTVSKDGYTINYNTVSIVEYIKFASKICNANFIFNEAELPFTVTVVSDAPITPENVMATLIQILRIHGMMLLEQGNNLVIHKSGAVRQPATLVFDDEKNTTNAPIITRVYRLKNANVDSVAAIVRPMISEGAIIEVSHETRQLILTDVTMVVDKISALIENLDSPHTSLEIRNFEAKFNKPEYLIELASQIMRPIAQGNPFILVPQSLANAVFIVSTPELNEKAVAVLTNLDSPPKKVVLSERKIKSENIFVIKLEHRPGDEVLRSLKDISNNLQETGILENDLLETIEGAKWIRETNSLLFVGSAESHIKIKELVASLDVGGAGEGAKASFFVYRPQNRGLDEIQKSMQDMADNLAKTKGADESLIAAIRSQKANPVTNTILYSGDPAAFAKIKDLLLTIDTPSSKANKLPSRQNFFVYKIQSSSPQQLQDSLVSFANSLENTGVTETGLIDAITSAKYIKETHSLVFVGSDDVLKRLQEIVPQFDAGIQEAVPASTQFLAYKPQYVKGEMLVKLLKETLDNLKTNLSDPALLQSLESMKWVKSTNTLLFTGDPASLKRMEELIATLDLPAPLKKEAMKGNYFIYKLQNPYGRLVEDDLENLLNNMKAAGMKETPLVKVLENMRYVKETDSILLTGDPAGIEEAKELIAQYDQPRSTAPNRNVFMFKPENVSPAKVEKAINEIRTSLGQAEMSDPGLVAVIGSMKYVESTHSFIFHGTPEAIAKIQVILKDIDTAAQAPINVGKSNFFFYKLKYASGPQITASLKTIGNDLKKSGTGDVEFLNALESLKYVKETNSLMFTGSEEALAKVQTLVSQFDIGNAKAAPKEISVGPSEFFVYKPITLPGPDLEATLNDFAENLRSGGLNDPGLFNTLQSMKYIEKTQSLVFTGDQKSLDRVKQLLKDFDIPANLPAGTGPESNIQEIDNTSFLVYKLEFHKGDEIQNALRQIAKDLILSNAVVNQDLLNAINSIQWLEVTNSLLCTGDQETLTRLRELVKSLDVPLKQVFIEVLVIETTLTNAVTFGLEWGGKVQYDNKVVGSFNNFIPSTANPYPTVPSFENSFGQVNATTTPNTLPTQTAIPFQPQFDLGVIGDIIKYNGKSFLSLGSLLNALESDQEITVVMTPKIIAQDSKQATIFSGQNVPFAGSFVSNIQSSGTVSTSNIEYRDVGFNLTITPVLGNSEIITMDISLDNSTQLQNSSGATFGFQNGGTATGITTSRTTMATTVHVPNKNFLVLSGMVNNSNNRTKTGIPCLGGIPILGSAFSTNNDTVNNTNVVIFLRPTIINSLEEMKRLTGDQEEFFRNQAGTPALEHGYDEGMELIKTPEDE